MKKLLLLLLCTVASYGQTYQNPTFGTVTTKTTPTVTTPAFIGTLEATGVNGKIPSTYIEKTENKQNDLATDGTGNKYPTVDAVNTLKRYTKEITVGVGGTYPTLELLFANEPAGKTLIKLTDSNYTSTNPQFVVKTGWILQGQGYGKTNLTFNFTTAIDPNLSGLQIRTDCELVDFKVTSINNTDLGGFSQYALHSDYTGAFTAKITRCWFKTVASPNVVDASGYNGLAVGIGTWEGQVLEFHESILQGQSISIDDRYTLNIHNTFLSTVHTTPSRVSFYNSQLTGGFTTLLISDTYSNSTESDSARIKDLFEFVGCEIKGGIYLRTANQLGGTDRKNGLAFNFSGTNVDEFINVGEIVNTSLPNYDVTSLPLTKDVDFQKNLGASTINEGDFVSYVYANRIPEYHRPEAIMTPIGIEKLDSTNVKYFAGISLTDSFVGDFGHVAKGAIAYTKDAFADIEIGDKLAFNDGGVLVKSSISGIGTVIKKTTDNRLGILLMPSGRKENTIGDYTDRGLLQIRGNSGGVGQPSIFLEDKNIYGGFTNYAISAGSNSNRLFPETVEEGRFSINDNLAGRERLGIDIAGDVYLDRRLINYSINNVNSPILGIHSGNASFLSPDGLNGLNFGASQSSGNGWIQVHENIGGVGIAHDLLLQPSGGNVLIGGSVSATSYTGGAALTGTPTAPTAPVGTNTTQIATTAFVQANSNANGLLEYNSTDKTIWNNGKSNISSNTSFGDLALIANTTGNNNASNGYGSLYSNTTGVSNSAFGFYSIFSNTTGSNNTATGAQSLFQTSGSDNTASGSSAGRYFGSGTSLNDVSNNSVFIGSHSRASASGETNQIVIGYNAIGSGSNSVTLGNTSVTKTILRGVVTYSAEYTVATLPTPTGKAFAVVTDAIAPSYMATAVGGGTVITPVFYNGTTWVCH